MIFMKYDVMVEAKERIISIKKESYYEHKDVTKGFNPIESFEAVKKQTEDRGNNFATGSPFRMMSYSLIKCPDSFHLVNKTIHKNWEYLKTIDIQDGELRKNDFYEIDGNKCAFEIIYNNKTDKVELRVNYTMAVVENELNEQTKLKYDKFEKLLSEYEKEKKLRRQIKSEILKEMRENEIKELSSISANTQKNTLWKKLTHGIRW